MRSVGPGAKRPDCPGVVDSTSRGTGTATAPAGRGSLALAQMDPSGDSPRRSGDGAGAQALAAWLERNAVDSLPAGDLQRKLDLGRPLRVKLGIDPTAPDIHL